MSEKKIIRQKMLKYVSRLSEYERKKIEEKMQQQLFANPVFQQASTIGITISTAIEWNTYPIIEKAWEQGKVVASPKCIVKTKEMQYYAWRQANQIQDGYAGIKEPIPEKTKPIQSNVIDLLLVPGVVFDKDGYRIGYGGGYYDRMLADYTGATIALCSEQQIVDKIPRASYDLPVEQMITEERMIKIPKQHI
ncbi:5-formyltetrahydrofolate cyclo-ligase [Oceanobacillus sp. CFH 90083]|uniref:5-formyltetrahydrofolate cyclo-ligase n=1 Tax=Oceanobacillus sp. CFH 90083 TaxID=2592336 RepID=UPI00188487EE|nr:5-formyltetrahydrofolate cyclo-ligase [Oceanobacillus sp. CFH 90083]